MWTRREMLKSTAQLGAIFVAPTSMGSACAAEPPGIEVNDVQSQLNATRVHRVVMPTSTGDVHRALRAARQEGRAISVAGGRHSMGGQQFGRDTILLDMRQFNRVVSLDRKNGLIEVEAGIQWPELIAYLHREQAGRNETWAIRQKQTGVDRVTLGGSLAANIHGRGLKFPPLIDDVESFVLLDAQGKTHTCSRTENTELFSLAIGGYGLFGIVTHLTLRLVPRVKVLRIVELIAVQDLLESVDQRLQQGFLYGDCQYSTDLETDAESHAGIFSCYRSVPLETAIPEGQRQLSADEWAEFYRLARSDKKKAFQQFAEYYLATEGQVYWSDTQQLAGDFEGHRAAIDAQRGTEMITEVYVSKENFVPLLAQARQDFLEYNVDMTYGTIRFIEKDSESFLSWAQEPSVCIVCNLHVRHTEAGRQKAAEDFRRIIDRVIQFGGRYFLTYHRWATRTQVEACYPRFAEFLRLKRKYDPDERFQSEWYRHYREMFKERS